MREPEESKTAAVPWEAILSRITHRHFEMDSPLGRLSMKARNSSERWRSIIQSSARGRVFLIRNKHIALASYRFEIARMSWILLNLAAQPGNLNINCPLLI